MHLQCTMSSIFEREVRKLGMRDTLKHGTLTVSGFGYFHKNCRFLWGKMFQRQIQEVQYTILIRHITNVSDFVWFQRSCGSMKSVSSFSSIDTPSFLIQSGEEGTQRRSSCENFIWLTSCYNLQSTKYGEITHR